ncbi:hypothetical protein ADUPG1_009859, partial [Aduncisulcus paluster]
MFELLDINGSSLPNSRVVGLFDEQLTLLVSERKGKGNNTISILYLIDNDRPSSPPIILLQMSHSCRIYSASICSKVKSVALVLVSLDHVVIRDIEFLESGENPPTEPPLPFEILKTQPGLFFTPVIMNIGRKPQIIGKESLDPYNLYILPKPPQRKDGLLRLLFLSPNNAIIKSISFTYREVPQRHGGAQQEVEEGIMIKDLVTIYPEKTFKFLFSYYSPRTNRLYVIKYKSSVGLLSRKEMHSHTLDIIGITMLGIPKVMISTAIPILDRCVGVGRKLQLENINPIEIDFGDKLRFSSFTRHINAESSASPSFSSSHSAGVSFSGGIGGGYESVLRCSWHESPMTSILPFIRHSLMFPILSSIPYPPLEYLSPTLMFVSLNPQETACTLALAICGCVYVITMCFRSGSVCTVCVGDCVGVWCVWGLGNATIYVERRKRREWRKNSTDIEVDVESEGEEGKREDDGEEDEEEDEKVEDINRHSGSQTFCPTLEILVMDVCG